MRTKLTSAELTVRIEDLYGAPLTTLEAHAQTQPPGMLAALLGSRHDLAFAERTIAFHRDRLLQLIQPERGIAPTRRPTFSTVLAASLKPLPHGRPRPRPPQRS